MSAITTTDFSMMESDDLPTLAGTIQWEFEKAEKVAETALGHGIHCGHALNAAKKKVPHGAWMRWIEDNTSIPHSTVNMFMALASNSQRVENLESIRGALKLLADDKAEAQRRQISETYIPYDGETAPSPAPPAPRPSPAPSKPTLPLGAIYQDAEIVEQEPHHEEPEPLVADGTKQEAQLSEKESVRLLELESVIAKAEDPSDGEDPIEDAIGRLVFVLLSRKCSADYINSLTDSVRKNEAASPGSTQ